MKRNHYYEKISTRNNRSINTQKYNIGISRVSLTDVQEITEYEDSTDNYFTTINKSKGLALKNKKLGSNILITKKLFDKGKKNQITKKKESSKSSIDSSSSAKLSLRLRGGTDFFRSQLKTKRIFDDNKDRFLRSKNTRKPIVTRKQNEFNYQKFVNGKAKNKSLLKLPSFQRERQSTEQTKTLKSVSKLTVLLLYLHFLLSYYLSFSKSQRFEEMFEMCETETRYE